VGERRAGSLAQSRAAHWRRRLPVLSAHDQHLLAQSHDVPRAMIPEQQREHPAERRKQNQNRVAEHGRRMA